MTRFHTLRRPLLTLSLVLVATSAFAQAQAQTKPFEPQSGQAGKDVVWVPTPQPLVDMMLDMAKVTPQDYVIDLGSGDGRLVIAAVKEFGARGGFGVDINEGYVAYANAKAA